MLSSVIAASPIPPSALGTPLWGQCHSRSPSDSQTNHRLLCVSGCIKETQVDPDSEKKEGPASSIALLLTEKSSASSWLVTVYTHFYKEDFKCQPVLYGETLEV